MMYSKWLKSQRAQYQIKIDVVISMAFHANNLPRNLSEATNEAGNRNAAPECRVSKFVFQMQIGLVRANMHNVRVDRLHSTLLHIACAERP